jgi:hypothetical protein
MWELCRWLLAAVPTMNGFHRIAPSIDEENIFIEMFRESSFYFLFLEAQFPFARPRI